MYVLMGFADKVPVIFFTNPRRLVLFTSLRGMSPRLGRSQQPRADRILGTELSGIGFLFRVRRLCSHASDWSRNVTTGPIAFARCSSVLIPCPTSHSAPKRFASDFVFFPCPTAR